MALKRMFSMKIVDTDAFTEMPNDAQLLYFRLCMAADDDGFLANPRRVMRSYGFGEDSMKLLIAKKFTLVLKHAENVILLIKHWKMHNTIQSDRYHPSPYHDLLHYVYLDKNNAYSLTPGEDKRPALTGGTGSVLPGAALSSANLYTEMDTDCIHPVSPDKDKVSIREELELDKISIDQSKGKEGYGGKNQKAADVLTGQDRKDRLMEHAKRVKIFVSHHFDPQGIYRLAEADGFTREEIDACLQEEET